MNPFLTPKRSPETRKIIEILCTVCKFCGLAILSSSGRRRSTWNPLGPPWVTFGPQTGPQELPERLQNSFKTTQDASKLAPMASKIAPKVLENPSKRPPRDLQEAPRELQEASRRPQDHSKRPQHGSKSAPRGLGTFQETPRAPQKVPRRLRKAQDSSKSLQDAPTPPRATTGDLEKFSLAGIREG